MENINQPGGLLDTFLTFAMPGYGLLRNMKAMEDPQKYGQGTLYGMGTNYGKTDFSLSNVGNNLGFGGGDSWFGGQPQAQSPYTSGYGLSDGGWFGTGIGANVGMDTGLSGAFGEDAYDVSQGTIGSTGYDSYGGYSADDEGDAQAMSDWG